ncbi:hypothetical protein FCV25MIE_13502, partial [Fagus crenata]
VLSSPVVATQNLYPLRAACHSARQNRISSRQKTCTDPPSDAPPWSNIILGAQYRSFPATAVKPLCLSRAHHHWTALPPISRTPQDSRQTGVGRATTHQILHRKNRPLLLSPPSLGFSIHLMPTIIVLLSPDLSFLGKSLESDARHVGLDLGGLCPAEPDPDMPNP